MTLKDEILVVISRGVTEIERLLNARQGRAKAYIHN